MLYIFLIERSFNEKISEKLFSIQHCKSRIDLTIESLSFSIVAL